MLLPLFTPDDVLPPGDYPMTLEELRRSSLVTGAGSPSFRKSRRDHRPKGIIQIVK